MPMYKVILTYKYTEEVVVDAESEKDAERMSYHAETTRNNDDSLYDIFVQEFDNCDE